MIINHITIRYKTIVVSQIYGKMIQTTNITIKIQLVEYYQQK